MAIKRGDLIWIEPPLASGGMADVWRVINRGAEGVHSIAVVKRILINYASNIEFNLPKPSYTIDTLTYLHEHYPNYHFNIIMGSDNLENFHKWKNYESIVNNYGVIVYPRPGFNREKIKSHKNISIAEKTPLMEISSSFIREAISEGKNVKHFVPPKSYAYLEEMNFYKK